MLVAAAAARERPLVMWFLTATAWVLGGALALFTIPLWVLLGVTLPYFKLLRRGTDLAWFDWPFFLVMVVTGGLVNVATMAIVSLVHGVTGVWLFPPPPGWGPPRPPAGSA
jgi:hypothetical protein